MRSFNFEVWQDTPDSHGTQTAWLVLFNKFTGYRQVEHIYQYTDLDVVLSDVGRVYSGYMPKYENIKSDIIGRGETQQEWYERVLVLASAEDPNSVEMIASSKPQQQMCYTCRQLANVA